MKIWFGVLSLSASICFVSCEPSSDSDSDRPDPAAGEAPETGAPETGAPETTDSTLTTGMKGVILFYEGDFMPQIVEPGEPPKPSGGTMTPVKRQILLYEKTHITDVEGQDGPFYDAILSQLVGQTESDANGYFEIQLPAGEYSIFIEEDGRFYSNGFAGQGYIYPISVIDSNMTEITFRIMYLAWF